MNRIYKIKKNKKFLLAQMRIVEVVKQVVDCTLEIKPITIVLKLGFTANGKKIHTTHTSRRTVQGILNILQ